MRRGIPVALGNAAMSVMKYGNFFIMTNTVQDDREDVEVFMPGVCADYVFEITREGRIIKAFAEQKNENRIVLKGIFPRISTRTFIIKDK